MGLFLRYDTADGHILQTGYCEDGYEDRQFAPPGHAVLAGALGRIDLDWIDAGAVREREALPVTVSKPTFTADGVEETVLSGFPPSCTITVDGTEHELTGGTLTLTSAMPATYAIACRHWPYLDWEGRVEAVA